MLHDHNAIMQELLFGIVATENGGAAVFLSRTDETVPKAFVEELLSEEPERICSLIAQFAFVYIENTFFSKIWWDSLSVLDRQHMASLAWVSNAYYESFKYSGSRRIVPWEIAGIQVNGH